jgi:hypothetical protein
MRYSPMLNLILTLTLTLGKAAGLVSGCILLIWKSRGVYRHKHFRKVAIASYCQVFGYVSSGMLSVMVHDMASINCNYNFNLDRNFNSF